MEEAKQPEQNANSENAYQFDVSERGDKVTIKAKKSLNSQQAEDDYYLLLKTLLNINSIELEILKYANNSERVGRFIDIDPATLKGKLPLKSTSKINEAIEALHQKGILLKTKYSGLYDLVSPIAEYKRGKSIQLEISMNVDEQ
jgi:hypothetical protein